MGKILNAVQPIIYIYIQILCIVCIYISHGVQI